MLFTANPTLTGTAQTGGTGPLLYATVNGSELATHTAAAGVVTYAATGAAFAATVSGAAAGANVNLSAATDTVSANQVINSLTISGTNNPTLTINAGVTLTVTSGAIFVGSGTTLTVTGGGTLAFGSADGVLQTVSGGTINVNASTTGTGGLTFAGAGNVNLNAASSISGVNQVQTISLSGVSAGNTFQLQLGAQIAGVTYSTTPAVLAANIQQALAALRTGSFLNLLVSSNAAAVP